MSSGLLCQDVGSTRYTVYFDVARNMFEVVAHTLERARAVAVGPVEPVWGDRIDGRPETELRHIPAVDEKFIYRFGGHEFDGDIEERATMALSEGMIRLQPKVEENARRRLKGEQTLQEYEAELRAEERERKRELDYLARAAEREAQRQQEELEALPGYGMF